MSQNHNDIQLIFFNISKAFDKVWHTGLLHKLQCIGIKGSLYHLFCDYLHNRKQRVVLNGSLQLGKLSKQVCHKALSLDQFCFLYINDMSAKASLFADDTSLSKRIVDNHTSDNEVQADLNTT